MNGRKTSGRVIGAGLASAIAASLCCITPVLAIIAGSSGIASTFAWIDPARPYLIGVSILVLGFAWYQKFRPQPVDECGCEVVEKQKFIHSKTFLSIVTILAILMIAFPSYAKVFFPASENQINVVDNSNIQTAEFSIKGMNCAGCELEVNHEVYKLSGIIKSETSYDSGKSNVQFDNSKTNVEEIKQAINSTGYSVTNAEIQNKQL